MISTVIFDLSDVYLEGLKGVEHRLEPFLGMESREIFEKLNGKELEDLFHGRISEDEYWSRTMTKNGWNMIDKSALKKAVRENFSEIAGTKEIIQRLKERGLRLGLLSVHAREWVEFCKEKFGYHRLFDSALYSFEVAASKPDEKAYLLILDRLKARAEECVFVDDMEANLVPARRLGMKTILFRGPELLERELVSLGLL